MDRRLSFAEAARGWASPGPRGLGFLLGGFLLGSIRLGPRAYRAVEPIGRRRYPRTDIARDLTCPLATEFSISVGHFHGDKQIGVQFFWRRVFGAIEINFRTGGPLGRFHLARLDVLIGSEPGVTQVFRSGRRG